MTLRMSYSPLMWACLYGHTEVAEKLLEAGADTTHRGRLLSCYGRRWNEANAPNAIEVARIKGHKEIANLIINAEKKRAAKKTCGIAVATVARTE